MNREAASPPSVLPGSEQGVMALTVSVDDDHRASFQVPATTAAGDVAAAAAERLGLVASPGLRLLRADGSVLDPSSSLTEAGLAWGEALRLTGEEPAATPPKVETAPVRPQTETPPAAGVVTARNAVPRPIARTRSLLPSELSFATRLTSALGAAFGGGTRPAPTGDLALPKRQSARARARAAWRESDYLTRLDHQIAAPVTRNGITIAVLSPKGGVGKTTVTALLGTLLAMLRTERVVALDANPDYGSLGRVLVSDHETYVDDFLALRNRLETITALDAQFGRGPHKLLVLPAPPDPDRMRQLGSTDYAAVIAELQALMGLVLVDCGTGLQDGITTAAIDAADQLLLVTDTDPASADLVARAATSLLARRKPVYLVVNKVAGRGNRLNTDALASRISGAAAMVTIPADITAAGLLATGEFSWDEAPTGWARGVRELAACLAADWSQLPGVEVDLRRPAN